MIVWSRTHGRMCKVVRQLNQELLLRDVEGNLYYDYVCFCKIL